MTTTDLALSSHILRRKEAKPGTRGPHINLFSGGLPKVQAKTATSTTAERVAAFTAKQKMGADTAAVFALVVEHHERTGDPLVIDGFEIAQRAGVSYERAHAIRSELLGVGMIRVRSGNAWGIDGLVPGDAWSQQ